MPAGGGQERAGEPEGVESGLAGREGQDGGSHVEGQGGAVEPEVDAVAEPAAFVLLERTSLVSRARPVRLVADLLDRLEGGDLGHVDDELDADAVGLHPETAVGVDGEVPERMGAGGGGGGEDGASGDDQH